MSKRRRRLVETVETTDTNEQPPISEATLDEAEPLKADLISDGSETGQLIEALVPDGSVVDVLVIKPGTSANRRRYRKEVLEEAVAKFDGARAFAGFGPDHNPRERGVRSLVGWWSEPRWYEGENASGENVEGVAAKFNILESANWLRSMAVEAIRRNKPDLFGYSIVGDGPTGRAFESIGGRRRAVSDVKRIDLIESVDPVIHPAAGGQALRLLASREDPHPMNWDKMTLVEAVQGMAAGDFTVDELKENREDLATAIDSGDFVTEKVVEKVVEVEKIVEAAPVEEPADEDALPDFDAMVKEAVDTALAPARTTALVESRLADRNLPKVVVENIRKQTAGQALDEDAIDSLIESTVEFVKKVAPATVADAGSAKVSDMKDERERFTEAMTAILDGTSNDSMRAIYVELTGDSEGTGRLAEGGRLTESITTATFAEIFQDSALKSMQKVYAQPGLDSWRSIASVVPVSDFKTVHRIRMGGYGNLPAVNQGAAYGALTTPGDEEATYAPTKRGGTEDLTLEAIVNDDIGQMRNIPKRLGRAAAQTLYEFVWDFLANNAQTDYDTTALAAAGHNNLGAAALDAASLVAGRQAMQKQTDFSSSKRLGIRPRILAVPIELEQTAYELTQTDREVDSPNNNLNFVRTFGLSVIVVEYWTDANNWWLIADPMDVERVEVGFLNGKEEPEMFLQDQPTNGSVFSNDKLTYKIRHIYGAALMDHRGFYGGLVA